VKSLYLAIGVATVAVLLVAMLVYGAISQSVITGYFNPVFDDMDEVSVQESAEMLQTSGPAAVTAYMHRLDNVFGGSHHLVDANGKDVVTGADFSRYLPAAGLTKFRGVKNSEHIIAHRSGDGKYWFVVFSYYEPKSGRAPLYKYYLLLVGATLLMCWLGAVYLISPIRKIAGGIKKFGEGDLTVRLSQARSDEIGSLAKAFNGMAERIEVLFKSEQRFLADVSHELRSPLARLHFSIKLARTAPDRDAALDRVKRDVDRLTTLVSSLVEIARAEGSASRPMQNEVHIGHLVEQTVEDCAVEVEARGGRIDFQDTTDATACGDPELLRRAIENVIRNAIRYSPQGAVIDAKIEAHDQTLEISVRDRGPGVAAEFLDRIFDSFFRTDEARDTDSGGVGLGLAIAKRAVQIHGGSIRAENANPGLRVVIQLPIEVRAHDTTLA
jgi:signal transduction histidine kinase